jgi:hypothetical protein
MMARRTALLPAAVPALLGALLLVPASGLLAQPVDAGSVPELGGTAPEVPAFLPGAPETRASDPDFLFRAPRVTLTLRTGRFWYRADAPPGSFFDVTTRDYTVESSDFRSLDLGAELALAVNDRLDLTVAFDGGRVQLHHESREFEELDGTPIFQSTRVRSGPAAQVGLRAFLLPRGEQLSTFAWVPSPVAPFVGAGLGWMGYDVRQWGDFVFSTPEGEFIQADDLTGNGGAAVLYASAGADVALRRNLALTLEARYQQAEGDLGGNFRFSNPTLDLSGLRLTAGISVRF